MRIVGRASLVTVATALVVLLAAPAAGAQKARSGSVGAGLRFHTDVVEDPMSNGIEAFRLLLPGRAPAEPALVRRVALPKVARALTAKGRGAVTSSTYDAARVRIAYTQNGRAMEEEFYAIVSYTTSPSLPGMTMWQPKFLYSFKAPRGKLDGSARILQTMISSMRLSLKWYAGYQSVFNQWVNGQMQAINAAGRLSKYIASVNDSITRSTREAWEDQQASYDRVYGAISVQIRGVETYQNPFEGRAVELPNDYRYASVSSNGQYALSDSASFNPNFGSTIEWRLLRTGG